MLGHRITNQTLVAGLFLAMIVYYGAPGLLLWLSNPDGALWPQMKRLFIPTLLAAAGVFGSLASQRSWKRLVWLLPLYQIGLLTYEILAGSISSMWLLIRSFAILATWTMLGILANRIITRERA